MSFKRSYIYINKIKERMSINLNINKNNNFKKIKIKNHQLKKKGEELLGLAYFVRAILLFFIANWLKIRVDCFLLINSFFTPNT